MVPSPTSTASAESMRTHDAHASNREDPTSTPTVSNTLTTMSYSTAASMPGHRHAGKSSNTACNGYGPITTTLTSYYEDKPKPTDRLAGAARVRGFALYLGNVQSGCPSQSIARWCRKYKYNWMHQEVVGLRLPSEHVQSTTISDGRS